MTLEAAAGHAPAALGAYTPERLSSAARALIENPQNELTFSPASLWEMVIKRALGRPDFRIDPRRLRRG